MSEVRLSLLFSSHILGPVFTARLHRYFEPFFVKDYNHSQEYFTAHAC